MTQILLSKLKGNLSLAAAWRKTQFIHRLVEKILDTCTTVMVATRRLEDILEVVRTGDASGRHGWAGGSQSDVAMWRVS